jgi:hypothetical protein
MKFSAFALCAGLVLASTSSLAAQQQQQQPMPAASAQPATPTTAVNAATVTLSPPNKQGPSGSAQLVQQGSAVIVTIHGLRDQTTAAVLSGKCTNTEKPDVSGPAQALKPLVNGSSQTVLPNTTVAQLASTPHAIVVQGGVAPTLCGDVSALPAAPTALPHP